MTATSASITAATAKLPRRYVSRQKLCLRGTTDYWITDAVGKPNEDGTPRRTRYERLLEDVIQKGQKTKVLLLSATPVNNQIADLRNQISFIAGGDVARDADGKHNGAFKEKLGIPSIKDTTRKAQAKFTNWTKKPADQRKARDLIHELGSDFFKLLDGLSIARSRSQIKRYYAKEMERLGGFPKRENPAPNTRQRSATSTRKAASGSLSA